MEQLVIHPMQEKERPALRRLYLQTRRESFFWLDSQSMKLEDFDGDTQGERVFTASVNGKLAGFLSVWEPDRFVHCLYVAGEFQHQGVGSRLLEEAVQRFGPPLELKCLCQNSAALAFYLAGGWQITDEGMCEEGPWYRMRFSGKEKPVL